MPRGHRTTSYLATAAIASALLAVVAGSGGCEVIVGHDLPAFACDPGPGKHDLCPGNEICDPYTNQCVQPCGSTGCQGSATCDPGSQLCVPVDAAPPTDDVTVNEAGDEPTGSNDADAMTRPDEAAPPPDTGGGDSPGPCNALGCKCSGGADCLSGVCGDQLTVTSGLYTVAGNANFCTKPCCTSADCDAHTVCFATSSGGAYCVLPSWIGRSSTFGQGIGGSLCSSNAECRSGLCAGTACADTCCSTSTTGQCASNTVCRFQSFPGTGIDTHYSANCGSPTGNGGNGSNCNQNGSCRSNFCAADSMFGSNYCHNACRSTADCGSGEACTYVLPNSTNDVIATCTISSTTTPEGQACNPQNSNCATGICDPTTQLCTDPCFANSDCTKSGWRCRPEVIPVQGGGSYSVLLCGT